MKRIFTFLFSIAFTAATFAQVGLKINEVDYDQLNLDSAEFLEIYNADLNAIDLADYTIILMNCNNNLLTPYDTISLPTHTLNPGSFYVICGNGGFVPNCDLVLPTYSNILQNGAPDGIGIIDNISATMIDAVSYEGSCQTPFVEGTGAGLDTVYTMTGLSRFPDGMDSNDNSADFRAACSTPGTSNANDTINCATGISGVALINTIRVYPNPSKGISTIDCRGLKNANITVKNVIGNEVKAVVLKGQDSYQLDLTEYANGVYFIQIKSDAAEYTQRIILRK